MKAGWQTKSLGEVCTLQRGFDLPTQNRISGRFPLVSSSGIIDTHYEGPVKGPGVVTGRSGSLGSVFFVEEDFWPLNTTLYVRDFHGNDPRFVYHLLNNFDLTRFAGGTGVPTLNRNDVHGELVEVPSEIAEQQRIVGILDEAFDGIATAEANAEQNLQNARALFESHLQSIFTQRGEGWVERSIAQCFKVRSGDFLPAKAMVVTGQFDVYGGNGINGKHDQSNLSGENIIIGRVGAKCGNVRFVRGDLWLTDNAFYISEFFQNFHLPFLARLLELKQLRDTANQAAQPVISYTTIKGVLLEFPNSITEQQKTADAIDELEEETQRLESLYQRKLAALDELKKSLLHQAFSGAL